MDFIFSEDNKISVIYKQVNKLPKVISIENSLEAIQKIINSEVTIIPYRNYLQIVCVKDNLKKGYNINTIFDCACVAGDFIVVGISYGKGRFRTLRKNEITETKIDIKNRSINYDIQKLCDKEM